MKPQDIVFIFITGVLFIWHKPRIFLCAGLISFVAAIPLFGAWVFFTAERLTWYASAWILIACFLHLFRGGKGHI